MPRIRTIKPTHWSDKELAKISLQAHLLWIATWNFSDDEGIFEGDTLLIKSQIFPRRTDIRVDQIQSWLDQLVTARFLIHFKYKNEVYYVSRTFKTHQRIDKAQPSHIPSQILEKVFQEHSKNGIGAVPPVEESKGMESKVEEYPPYGVEETKVSSIDIRKAYSDLVKDKKSICDFIKNKGPDFIEPYADLWNLFAEDKSLAKISKLTDTRKGKFKIRIREKAFDFFEVLKKAAQSEFLLTHKWFGFDWIFENEVNYLKIIEGSYDKDNAKGAVKVSAPVMEVQYLLERFLEGNLDQTQILPTHFAELSKQSNVSINGSVVKKRMQELLGSNKFSESELYKDYEQRKKSKLVEEDRPQLMRLAVIEYFEEEKNKQRAFQ